MTTSSQSVLIVGGGIVGLCIAAAAKARGLAVTVVARDAARDTASGVAAGMVAPALEALGEPEPDVTYARLNTAQAAWNDLADAWPETVRDAIAAAQTEAHNLYVWPQSDNSSDITTPRLHAMGVAFAALSDEELAPVADDCDGVRVASDWLIAAEKTLDALSQHVVANGGKIMVSEVRALNKASITLDDGEVLHADHVVLAAGYGAKAFASDVPSVRVLTAIKGHLLDLPGTRPGVIRSPLGYLADYGGSAKFGATMQFGQDDSAIEPAVVADLGIRARQILPNLDLSQAVPRAGVRAATPDGWPLIGRDPVSGVLVAIGMRRNGYVFAPFAARILLAQIAGETGPADAHLYRPDRFSR